MVKHSVLTVLNMLEIKELHFSPAKFHVNLLKVLPVTSIALRFDDFDMTYFHGGDHEG